MYIPLYNKSNYTLLSSLLKIDDLINYAEKNNISSLALTDTTMYGTMEFITKCQTKNIKPIIGLDIILENYNIVLYAKDYQGYKSIIKLSTIQNEKKVTEDDLKKYNENVILIVPFKYKEQFNTLKEIYADIYLGYTTKKEELEALLITENIVFFRENLYLTKNDTNILPYLYRIRDGKTVSDDIDYEVENHELDITNLLDLTDNKGLINTLKIKIKKKMHLIFV